MNRSPSLVALAVGLVVVVGCGMGMSDPKTPADPAAYQQQALEAATQVEIHRAQAADGGTVGSCMAEHARYDGEVRPKLQKLQSLSSAMDGCMMQMGKAGDADLATNCSSMMSELDRHKTAACASDVATNKAEAGRHCDAMKTWLDSLNARSTFLKSGMGGMGDSCK